MCTLWMIKKLANLQGKVMCKKPSNLNGEELKNQRNRAVLPSSESSSRVTTPRNRVSSPSSSTSVREISTTFCSSPRSPTYSCSPRESEALEAKAGGWIAKDEARSGGSRLFLPKIKPGKKLKRRVTIGSTLSTSSGSGDAVEDADWPPFADEDYIVFCFEEDGAFHVIEDSPTTITPKLQCEEHGNLACACRDEDKDVNHMSLINRRDRLLPNKEAEEEISPRLHQDGTKGDHLKANNKFLHVKESTESMECRDGSVDSTDSSRLDDEEQFLNEHNNREVEYSSSPWNLISQDGNNALLAFRRDCLLPNIEVDEDDVFMSPKGKLGVMIRIDDLLKDNNDTSSIESDESSGFSGSDTKDDQDEQIEGNEDPAPESAKSSISNKSNSSKTSFEFPVLEWAWMGSPVTWPRSGRVFRKHKSRPACLRCCKF